MTIEITHVRFDGHFKSHHNVTHLRWSSGDEVSGGDRAALVALLDAGAQVCIRSETGLHRVFVVHETGIAPYVRAHSDKKWTNELMNLPTF